MLVFVLLHADPLVFMVHGAPKNITNLALIISLGFTHAFSLVQFKKYHIIECA